MDRTVNNLLLISLKYVLSVKEEHSQMTLEPRDRIRKIPL